MVGTWTFFTSTEKAPLHREEAPYIQHAEQARMYVPPVHFEPWRARKRSHHDREFCPMHVFLNLVSPYSMLSFILILVLSVGLA